MADTNVFKPKGDAKNEATTKTARAIIDSEAAARIAKTARLRKARLAQEPVEEPVKKVKKKAAAK
ncbi:MULTISPECIES: hypothetical protein [unclassified Mesorhizobium]|uniref:hypothetical protein n=1 Tax=unclassified Mesorhizobium TaxID=325217 RepID=UPI000BAF9F7C|nr:MULTISPECIES: hypothetical protein [unclassified Mesorhizobium]MBZ9816695.1 hypothetical protein [Mesorhizobium sp. CA7]PBB18284.1 hypothetical protein CK219_19795 [Mesorhizobium sp. WSM4313]TPJ23563.1 hypothetical protein FJ425_21720 [Mesorhizobium sp. B2-7-2]